uniref:Uncharacterized protein n=1 Tax=Cannabis sativa TaxID=3483 RepID=A0A803PEH7_CANSA
MVGKLLWKGISECCKFKYVNLGHHSGLGHALGAYVGANISEFHLIDVQSLFSEKYSTNLVKFAQASLGKTKFVPRLKCQPGRPLLGMGSFKMSFTKYHVLIFFLDGFEELGSKNVPRNLSPSCGVSRLTRGQLGCPLGLHSAQVSFLVDLSLKSETWLGYVSHVF